MTRYKTERLSRDRCKVGNLTIRWTWNYLVKRSRLVGPFKKVRTRKEVDFQWARAAVSAGLPMSFFDHEEVRKSVFMTSECVENYIRTKPSGVKETTVTHHTFFITKLIPKLDNFIDHKNMGKMREMTQELAGTVFNDG
jgi:hypothetical protein